MLLTPDRGRWLAMRVFALLVAMALSSVRGDGRQATGANWPQWRGPDGLGISPEAGFVREWSPTTNVLWKTEIPGRGLSSPVVWGNRVFLTTSVKGAPEPGRKAQVHLGFDYLPGYVHPDAVDIEFRHAVSVLAIDTRTGKVLWQQTPYDGVMFDDRHRKNTYASPTVATDGRMVYAYFESLGLYAYDFAGQLQWQTSLGPIIKAGLGPGTSPVLYEDLVILQCDQEMGDGSFMVGLDRRTGKEVWRTPRTTRRSWATPLLVRVGDHVELVASGGEVVIGYDPATGRERWRANGTESHPIPSPVAGNGLVVLAAGSQAKRAMAIRLGGSGDLRNSPSIVWRHNKGTAYVPSPILVGSYVYLMSDTGIVTCLDLESGKVVYEGGRVPVPATFTASPVAFGDVILLTSEDGDTFVLKAGPTHEVIRTNSVDEPVYASPALSNGVIFIRGAQHLFAIGDERKRPSKY
jgi:outer membrane protein assembly factor BamB